MALSVSALCRMTKSVDQSDVLLTQSVNQPYYLLWRTNVIGTLWRFG